MTIAVVTTVPATTDLLTVLGSDFVTACREFRRARDLQRAKDTPAHRAAIGGAREGIDAVLDMYLAIRKVADVVV